ncbi:MAG: segregation/condensation protein A [Acidobacteriaceae bacterium]|nr:segregation/condensation protein A [Acidobacteriaceae bacterium]
MPPSETNPQDELIEQQPDGQEPQQAEPDSSEQNEVVQAETAAPEAAAAETSSASGAAHFALEHPPVRPPAPEPRQKTDKEKEKEEASQSPFMITVGRVYDGPFDLLLDLIRKQNIDIYDIPMAKITAQFLEYTHHLKQTDVDSAGEFVYTASLLIHIKSKMLLPRDPMEVAAGIDEDPRRELVERLLEHERFKSAAQMLQQKQQIEDATWTQSGMKGFLLDEGVSSLDSEREIDADTSSLLLVFRDVLQKLRDRPVHRIDEESVTVAQMIQYVKQRLLMEDRPVSLRKLLGNARSERSLICTFLAMLELIRLQAILFRQPEALGDIMIKKAENFEQVMSENAVVRDDWS